VADNLGGVCYAHAHLLWKEAGHDIVLAPRDETLTSEVAEDFSNCNGANPRRLLLQPYEARTTEPRSRFLRDLSSVEVRDEVGQGLGESVIFVSFQHLNQVTRPKAGRPSG
jgi:hypothetical protein